MISLHESLTDIKLLKTPHDRFKWWSCVTMDTVPTNNCVSVFMGPLHHDQSLHDMKELKCYLSGQDTVHRPEPQQIHHSLVSYKHLQPFWNYCSNPIFGMEKRFTEVHKLWVICVTKPRQFKMIIYTWYFLKFMS